MQKSYYRVLLSVYIVSVVVCTTIQTVLRLRYTNTSTGFYNGGGNMVLALHVLIPAAVMFWFLMTLFRKTGHEFPVYHFGAAARVGSLICGCSILANTLAMSWSEFVRFVELTNWERLFFAAVLIFGVLGSCSMVWFAIRLSSEKGNIIGIFPAVWQLIVLLGRYKEVPTLTAVSESMFLVLFMCFATIFLLGQARTLCGYRPPNGRNYTIPAGLAASLFGLLLVVPGAANSLAEGRWSPLRGMEPVFWVYVLVLTIYVMIFLVDYIRSIRIV